MATSSNRETKIRIYTDYPTSYFDITDSIVAGSMRLEETLCDKSLSFGAICSNMFECTIENNCSIPRKTYIRVIQTIDGTTDKILFTGRVDTAKTDVYGYFLTITAFDTLYYTKSRNVRKWWKQYWQNSSNDFTVAGITRALLAKYNVEHTALNFPFGSLVVPQPTEFKKITFEELLLQFCSIQAVFPNVNRQGKLSFVKLANGLADVTINTNEYEYGSSEYDNYNTDKYDAVSISSSTTTIESDESSTDTPNYIYEFAENMAFEGMSEANMGTYANLILDEIDDIKYRPFSLKMIQSDLDYKLGDYVKVNALKNGQPVSFKSWIFKNELSGQYLIEQTISADGDAGLGEGGEPTINVTLSLSGGYNDEITIKNGSTLLQTVTLSGTSGTCTLSGLSIGTELTVASTKYKDGDDYYSTNVTIESTAQNVYVYPHGDEGQTVFWYGNAVIPMTSKAYVQNTTKYKYLNGEPTLSDNYLEFNTNPNHVSSDSREWWYSHNSSISFNNLDNIEVHFIDASMVTYSTATGSADYGIDVLLVNELASNPSDLEKQVVINSLGSVEDKTIRMQTNKTSGYIILSHKRIGSVYNTSKVDKIVVHYNHN